MQITKTKIEPKNKTKNFFEFQKFLKQSNLTHFYMLKIIKQVQRTKIKLQLLQ